MYFTTDPPIKAGFPFYKTVVALFCVLILIVNGFSLFHNLGALKESHAAQSQTALVVDKIQQVNLLIMDAESSLRAYFLSRNPIYLNPLNSADRDMAPRFAELDLLLAGSPAERKNLAQLQGLVKRKLANLHETLDVYEKGGLNDVLAISAITDERALLDEIGFQVAVMVGEQNLALSAGRTAFVAQYQHAVLLGIGINAMAIGVLLLFYRLVRRSFYVRVSAQRALQNANDNLESMVVLRTEQLSVLSRHLISVAEEEKARLARELHDELGANLTAINIDLNAVADQLRLSEPALADRLDRARGTLVNTVELKRRIVENLRPSLLDNLGLATALQSYIGEFGRVAGLDCQTLIDGEVDAAGPMQAIAVFRIVQESLNNIAKYACASSVIVHLAREDDRLALEISDDGIGIDDEAVSKPKSHGLLGMRERALLLGGTLQVQRGINNVGTCVTASIPVGETTTPAKQALENTAGQSYELPEASEPGALTAPHPSADDHILSLQPCNTHPHIPQDLDGQLR